MTNKVNESFSAFLDGEASELDIQRMLKALDEQPEVYSQWHDLSKTKALVEGDVLVETARDRAQLATPSAQPEQPKRGFVFRAKQTGIAAAVAVSLVGGATLINVDTKAVDVPVATIVAPVENSSQIAQQQFEAQQRLNLYLREHAEQASFTTGHVVAPAELEWLEVDVK